MIFFGKSPSPDQCFIDFGPNYPGISVRIARPETRGIPHSPEAQSAFEARVLAAARTARALIACATCEMMLQHQERRVCHVCQLSALDVIGASLVSQLPDVWMQTCGDNPTSLREHQSRLLWKDHPLTQEHRSR